MSIKTKIRNIIRRLGYDISKIGDVDLLESLIYKNFHKNFFFIQIGANDGKRFDPIFNIVNTLKLNGLVVEPIKEYFEELQRNYDGTEVVPVNKAIYFKNQKLTMYRVNSKNTLPEWTKGIASINPEHFRKSRTHKSYIIEEVVDGITFEKLLQEYNVTKLDFLQIDTEGYDIEIIKMIPFNKIKPTLIHFEHGIKEDVISKDDFLQGNKILIENGYKLIMKEYDCLAYL